MPYVTAVLFAGLGFVVAGLSLAGVVAPRSGTPVERAQVAVGLALAGILLGLLVGGAAQLVEIARDLRRRRVTRR